MHVKAKYRPSSKVPIVIFGDGLKNKENGRMRGQPPEASGVLLRSLYQRTKQLTAGAVMINEYNTSKVRHKEYLSHALSHNYSGLFWLPEEGHA